MAGAKCIYHFGSRTQSAINICRSVVVPARGYAKTSPQDPFSDIFLDDLKQMRRDSSLVTESQDRTIVNNVKPPYVKFSHHLRSLLDFTSMDYLGFQSNADVLSAYNKALVEEALGRRSGYKRGLKLELEAEIAIFHDRPACAFYSHVPDVKRVLLRALNTEDDVIFYDRYNEHSSYAMSSCVAQTVPFSHQNLDDLVQKLHTFKDKRHKMILLDCSFPFMGNAAPLREIAAIGQNHECLLVADDTYGVGMIGSELRGAEESLSEGQRPFLLTKSLEHIIGLNAYGYLVGPKALVDHISKLDVMEEYLDVPAPIIAITLKILSLLKKPGMEEAARSVLTMADHVRENLDAAGYYVDDCGLPVVSIHVGKESLLNEFQDQLQDAGILCSSSKDPFVPKGESRLCLAVTVHHTPELIDSALQKVLKVGSRLKIPRR